MKTTIGATVQGGTSIYYKTGDWRGSRPIFVSRVSPCREACPTGNDIQGFLWEAKNNRFDEAFQILIAENPFPSICGRVCGHPCETSCNRRDFDDPLAIHAIERFIGDYGLKKEIQLQPPPFRLRQRIAVVGSGPAGLSCAYYLIRSGYEVRVFESSPEAGGMLRWGIPEYRLPKTILDGEIGRLQKMGVKIETQVSLDKEFLEKGRQEYDAIFLALGSQKSRAMKIPGEGLPGIESGLKFLKKVRSGKKPLLGREVAVIGGGNTAIDLARIVLRLGSRPILIYRRTREEMPAISDEIEEASKEGVQMEFLTTLVSITPSEGQRLRLEGIKNRLAEPGSDGRRIPVPVEGSHWMIEVDYLISAIGETILSDDLLHPLAWTEIGIEVDEWGRTNLPGVFAGGDATPGPRTVSHAIAYGKKAALVMDAFLREEPFDRISPLLLGNRGSLSIEQWFNPPPITHRNDEVVRCEELNVFYFEHQAREEMPQLPKDGVRCSSFDEVNLGFSEKSAVQEAGRCFRCGMCNFCGNCYTFCPDSAVWKMEERKAFEFNYEFCKGCGICANECSSHFIDIVPEEK